MREVIRVRCPCCGMMPRLEQLANVDEKKPEVRIFVQKFGGKKPVEKTEEWKKTGRGKAPGFMSYEDITDTMEADQLKTITDWFVKRMEEYHSQSSS